MYLSKNMQPNVAVEYMVLLLLYSGGPGFRLNLETIVTRVFKVFLSPPKKMSG
jgi:hypothetical protein